MQKNISTAIELSVAEVAELKGCSVRFVRKQIQNSKLTATQRTNAKGRPCYFIPLSALEPKLQNRYLKATSAAHQRESEVFRFKSFEEYSGLEREKIYFWKVLLDEWQHSRNMRDEVSKAEADEQFCHYANVQSQAEYQRLFGRELNLNISTLYRRWRDYKAMDLDGLLDKRGSAAKGTSKVDDDVWRVFVDYFLNQAQYPVARCYEYTQLYVQEYRPELYPDIPSISSFRRRIEKDIPEPLLVLGRLGEKAYRDKCAPYIRRVYDDMQSNDYWVADTHTFDIISSDGEKTHRLYLVAFMDVRSNAMMGWHITETPSSQATLIALRKAIIKHGIPKHIYVDNGREFLTHDVGGLGHRAKKKHKLEEFVPPPVFTRLGIVMTNAIVRNARAKTIERRFRDVKDHVSRLFDTYTGGNVLERPEQLKYNLKKGKAVADRELTETIDLLLEYYMNEQEYGGTVAQDKGKSCIEVYYDNLEEIRVPQKEEDLNLLMMRSSRPQMVTRRGVNIKIGGVQYDFFNDVLLGAYLGKMVYYRYDPSDLRTVRVYNEDDVFLTEAPMDNVMVQAYGASKEDLAEAIREERKYERALKITMEHSGLDVVEQVDAVNLIMAKAKRAKAERKPQEAPRVIELASVYEEPVLDAAVGHEISETMIQNAIKYREERSMNDGTDL